MTANIDLPKVICVEKENDALTLTLEINKQLNVFNGHFDGSPIVPGIVQVSWALSFSNQYMQEHSALDIEGMDSIKFQNVITPGLIINLELAMKKNKICFSFSDKTRRFSSGKIAII